jgi:hypothetical protein
MNASLISTFILSSKVECQYKVESHFTHSGKKPSLLRTEKKEEVPFYAIERFFKL